MAAKIIQVAYKDASGRIQYQNISTSASIVTRAYNNIGTSKVQYTIPTTNQNQVYSFENITARRNADSMKDNRTVPRKVRPASKRADGSVAPAMNTGEIDIRNTANSAAAAYPKVKAVNSVSGRRKYDYELMIQTQRDIMQSIKAIKKNLNVPSAYTRLELNKLFHTEFNRFKVQYPDYFMNNTLGYVVFTRPDLNIFDGSNVHSQVANDPEMFYIANASPETAKLLTKGYSSAHYFNPLLSNTIMSLDVSDVSIDTLETGETFTGYKTQYAKSNIRSKTAGTISITFPETYNMAITHCHNLWTAYESGVYRGSLKPKEKYIWGKELDYACNIYYFLVDVEDMILRYWCKYTGCFPLNVNTSVFSYSGETQINHASLNVSYAYFAREDMNLINLDEFNNDGGGVSTSFRYKALYIPDLGSGGCTWSGVPFVRPIKRRTGFSRDAQLYALGFKP